MQTDFSKDNRQWRLRYLRVPNGHIKANGRPSRGDPVGVIAYRITGTEIEGTYSLAHENDLFSRARAMLCIAGRLQAKKQSYFKGDIFSIDDIDSIFGHLEEVVNPQTGRKEVRHKGLPYRLNELFNGIIVDEQDRYNFRNQEKQVVS